jgi:hypothetical protein
MNKKFKTNLADRLVCEWQELAREIDRLSRMTERQTNARAFVTDQGETVSVREEFNEKFNEAREEIAHSASLALLRSNDEFFAEVAKAIRKMRRERKRRKSGVGTQSANKRSVVMSALHRAKESGRPVSFGELSESTGFDASELRRIAVTEFGYKPQKRGRSINKDKLTRK